MTETMLVRAVKAVEAEIGKQEMVLTDPLTLRRMMATRAVRAALQAIREPDDVTAEAGWLNGEHTLEGMGPDFPSYVESCRSIFTAMIDSILSQSQEGK